MSSLLMVARMISVRDRALQGPSEHGFSHFNRAKQYYWWDCMYTENAQLLYLQIFLQLMRSSWGLWGPSVTLITRVLPDRERRHERGEKRFQMAQELESFSKKLIEQTIRPPPLRSWG